MTRYRLLVCFIVFFLATTVHAQLDVLDALGAPSTTQVENAPLTVRVIAPSQNYDPNFPDEIYGEVTTAVTGDREDLFLIETGPDTGVFTASLPTQAISISGAWYGSTVELGPRTMIDDPIEQITVSAAGFNVTVATVGAQAWFRNAQDAWVTELAFAEPLTIEVYRPTNSQVGTFDNLVVELTSSAGDYEVLYVDEAVDSHGNERNGWFTGSIVAGGGAVTTVDGILTAQIGDTYQLRYNPPQNAADVTATAIVVASSVGFVDRFGASVTELLDGDVAYLRVFDNEIGAAPGQGSVNVTVASGLTGDVETVALTETGSTRSLFAGRLSLASGVASSGNGALESTAGDTLTLTYDDGGTLVTATVTTVGSRIAWLDPYGRPAAFLIEHDANGIRVDAPSLDIAGQADTTQVSFAVNSDSETLTIPETTLGRFEGPVDIILGPAFVGNGIVESFGDPITATHTLGGSQVVTVREVTTGRTDAIDFLGRPTQRLPLDGEVILRAYSTSDNQDPANVDSAFGQIGFDFFSLDETAIDSAIFETVLATSGQFVGDTVIVDGPGPNISLTVSVGEIGVVDPVDQPVKALALGADLRVRAYAPFYDTDPATLDTVMLRLRNVNAPFEVDVTATEAAIDSGIFAIDLTTFVDDPGTGSGYVVAGMGDRIQVILDPYAATGVSAEVVFLDHAIPTAIDDLATTDEDLAVNVDVLANDVDPEGNSLNLVGVTQPAHGVVIIEVDDTLTYTPAPGFSGTDTFTYVIDDGEDGRAQATVTVTVTEIVAPPVANDDLFATDEDIAIDLDVLANDSIEGTVLSVEIQNPPFQGSVEVLPSFAVRYTPSPDVFGLDTFSYRVVTDGGEAYANVGVDVAPVNDPPVMSFIGVSPQGGEAPVRITFYDGYSYDPEDGQISTYHWDFGDGGTAAVNFVDHVYTEPGVYTVVLTVGDSEGATSSLSTTVTVTAPVRHALFVVADELALGAGDQAALDRMLADGYQVTVRSDNLVQGSEAELHDVVVISSSVTSNQVNTKFRDTWVPVLTWEPYLLDDMEMTGVAAQIDYGSELAQTTVRIADPLHPLALGLSDAVTVLDTPDRITWGRPASGAEIVATVDNNAERATLFVFEADAQLDGGLTAPGKRAAFFLNDLGPAYLTPDGWALFDATLCWMTNCTRAPVARISATATQGIAPLSADFHAYGSFGDAFPILDYHWDFGDGATANGVTTSHVFPEGDHIVTLTVTDEGGLTTSRSLLISVQPAGAPTVLLITGAVPPGPADTAVQTRLESLGYVVDVIQAAASTTADATGKALVAISSTVNSNQVNTKFRDVPVPVLTWEAWLYDDMGMTPAGRGTGYNVIANQVSITISDPSHPLAAGLSGAVSFVPGTTSLRWGAPVAGSEIAATLSGDPSKATVFGFDTGAQLLGLTAPARRVGVPFFDESAASFTGDGWALFDAAVAWAVGD
ncbi:MAG: PKD domain-containing protein [Acidobacteriota bacterium]